MRVRIEAAGVNPVETYIRTGTYARKPALPYTPGSDGAGVVEAVGDGVTALALGDRVFVAAFNGLLDRHLRRAGDRRRRAACIRCRTSLSFAQGAAVGVPCVTAWRALFQKAQRRGRRDRARARRERRRRHARPCSSRAAAGATVIATAGTAGGSRARRSRRARITSSITRRDGYRDEIMRLTGGRGPDVIIEMLANVNLAHDLAMIAPRGRIVIVGNRGIARFQSARDHGEGRDRHRHRRCRT